MGLTSHNYEPTLNGEGRELVVRKDVVQNGAWVESGVSTYANSAINSWFNGTYKGNFSTAVQTMIGSTTFYYTPGIGDNTVRTLGRAVFALSITELGLSGAGVNTEGTALPIASQLQVAHLNGGAAEQWTRTPGNTYGSVMYVTTGGASTRMDGYNLSGYRPCFTLPSTATVTEELELVEG